MAVKRVEPNSDDAEAGMRASAVEDQERQVKQSIQPLIEGEPLLPAELADRAAYSRFYFHRVFKRMMGETPGEMRRRLLLERAAWMLQKSSSSATEAAFEVGFESLEGFGRAFKKAFGVLPSGFSGSGLPLWLPASNGIHFSPLPLMPIGGKAMDLIDRLLDNETATLKSLLDPDKGIDEQGLDTELGVPVQAMCWEAEQRTVREALDNLIFTKEVWIAAVEKQTIPDARDSSREGLRKRAEIVLPMFAGLVRRVRDTGEWDTKFTDELCEQPVMFTFGGMIAHVLTHDIARRQAALAALRRKGFEVGWGDPLQWEQALT
jgi:AraC family transcriptional regulator